MKTRLMLVLLALVPASITLFAPAALAHCHSWMVAASPSSVKAGGTVTVTVTRDGNYKRSNVHVSTVSGTAKSPTDYPSLNANVDLPQNGATSKTYTIQTVKEAAPDPSETFKLHLSNPGGCDGSGYFVGSDATVTIQASTATKTATPAPTSHATATPTAHPTTTTHPAVTNRPVTAVHTATPTPKATPTVSPTATPEATILVPTPVTTATTSGSSSVKWLAIGLGGAALVGASIFGLWRARR